MMKSNRTFIIAEAGINHNGDLKRAFKMIDIAKSAKVDGIKFQIFNTEELVTKEAELADYAKRNSKTNSKQIKLLKKYQLGQEDHIRLMHYCFKKKIKYLCSAFDNSSLIFLKKKKLDIFKIPSGEITNYPYLKLLGSFKKKIILSTGMSTKDDIKKALKILTSSGTKKKNISILHCHSDYPSNFFDLNLLSIYDLKKSFKLKTGFSDHSLGIEASIAAVSLGAEIIEKHFTLDRNLSGPDHKASILPSELKLLVKSIRNVEFALGKNKKIVTKNELKNITASRKSIVAKSIIKKGEKFSEENITTKRPGNGISAINWTKVIGKKSNKNYLKNQQIKDI